MSIEPSRAEQLAAAIDTLVAEMVATPWPTTPQDHTRWAAQVGLPTTGQPDPDMDESMPDSSHFVAPDHPWRLSWHYFQGEFVGISLFPGNDLRPDELPTFARHLRGCFDARWDAVESIDASPPLTAFTSYWLPGPCMVDLYWHAPQILPFGGASVGAVQLAITDHARAEAEDAAHSGLTIRWK